MGKKSFDISRRGFLALTGTSGATLALSGCQPSRIADLLEFTETGQRVPPGPEKWVTALCAQCGGGCSIRVRTVGGRAVNITGNPLYPVNRTGVCPKGLTGLQALYNPDRIRTPLRRVGERGEGRWEPVSWEEAIESVAGKLREIRAQAPHGVVFLSGETRGIMDALISRFCRAYGTPNDIRAVPASIEGQQLTRYCSQGTYGSFAYDFDRTNYVLSFGAPLLDGYVSPVRMLRAYGQLREGRGDTKGTIVQIEPRLSVTAAKADEWVAINPGTEGALALGIAYILIRENLYDRRFIKRHTFGFEDWEDADGKEHVGFETSVLRNYNTDKVSRITGVPVATILRIAKSFATRKPAVALADLGSTNALYSLLAIHALNAMVGSIDVPGGVVFPEPPPLTLPDVELDTVAQRGSAQPRLDGPPPPHFPLARHKVSALADAIAAGKPYEAAALLLYQANPGFSSPQPGRFLEAFEKVPFIVSFASFVDESTAYADLVLPNHVYLERWQDDAAPPDVPYTLFGIGQPAVAPVHDTRHTGDVLMQIAQAMGGPVAKAFPWADYPAVLRESAAAIHKLRRGAIVEKFVETSWTALLEQRGWWSPAYETFDDFWARLLDKGGWWDPAYYHGEAQRIFQTPSGKFEFYSLTLRDRLRALADETSGEGVKQMLRDAQLTASGDLLYLPHFEEPRFAGKGEEYPLHLHVARLMALTEEYNANQPFLQEILGPHVQMQWDSWVEMNPETAHRMKIHQNELVWVESRAGKVRARVRLYPGIGPQMVSLPANLGHTAYGRWAQGIGVNPMTITADEKDLLGGLSAPAATRVRVYKA